MLTINPSEVIWTILGFLALYFLLRRFLYGPLIRHMDARNERIRAGLDEEKAAQGALEKQRELLAQARQESLAGAGEILREAGRQDERLHEQRLQAAHSAAQQAEADAEARAGELCEQAAVQLQEHGEELASALAERLFREGNRA